MRLETVVSTLFSLILLVGCANSPKPSPVVEDPQPNPPVATEAAPTEQPIPPRTTPPPPEYVKVFTHQVRIQIIPHVQCGPMKEAEGCTEMEKDLISVKAGLSPATERGTVMHEVLHAITYCNGTYVVNLGDEGRSYMYSEPLVQVLRENPALVKYLLAP